jgi:hypothetical protein
LDQPFLLQVLKQQLQGSSWQAAVQDLAKHQPTSTAPAPAAQAGTWHALPLPLQQLQAHTAAAGAPASGAEAEAAAEHLQGSLCAEPLSVPVGKAPSKSMSMGEASVGEESGLIGTQMHEEEEEEEEDAMALVSWVLGQSRCICVCDVPQDSHLVSDSGLCGALPSWQHILP